MQHSFLAQRVHSIPIFMLVLDTFNLAACTSLSEHSCVIYLSGGSCPCRFVVTALCGLLLNTAGVLPSSTMEYDVVQGYLLPLAVSLILFSADLRYEQQALLALLERMSAAVASQT